MRRADRLFQIVQLLRSGRSVTARRIAQRLSVSERTIYRDIRDLTLSGVPVEGEAGVGYVLRHFDVPPLMFTKDEIEALVAGARFVQAWAGHKLAESAQGALEKIETAIPERLRASIADTPVFAPGFHIAGELRSTFDVAQTGISEARRLRIDYRREDGHESARIVRPLGLFFWGSRWTLLGWCESRDDFRNFRLDRITSIDLDEPYEVAAGQTLADFMKSIGAG